MNHSYNIIGMTCEGCAAKVKYLLSNIKGVSNVTIRLKKNEGEVTMDHHIPIDEFKNALTGTKYKIEEEYSVNKVEEAATLKAYLPIFLIFGYITAITLIIQFSHSSFNMAQWMQQFMAGFFLVFSFFKLLDVPAFAMSYSSYDIVAKRWLGYGYVYPFLELVLGISFLFPVFYLWSNVITLIVMGVSIIGVLESVLNKRKIQCACLGAVFNLPMSTITIIEDAIMIVMSAFSLILIKN